MTSLRTRALSLLLCLGLAFGLGAAVSVPAPASAVDATCTTSVRWVASHKTWGVPKSLTVNYGRQFRLSAEVDVECTGNTDPETGVLWAGETQVQVSTDRGRHWRTVASASSPLVRWQGEWSIKRSVRVRARTTGGTSTYSDTFAPSTSSVVRVAVRRSATTRTKRVGEAVVAKARIAPASSIRGMRTTVQVRRHGDWRTVQRPVASRRGVVTVRLPRSDEGKRFRIQLPAGRGLEGSTVGPRRLRP